MLLHRIRRCHTLVTLPTSYPPFQGPCHTLVTRLSHDFCLVFRCFSAFFGTVISFFAENTENWSKTGQKERVTY